MTKTNDLMLHQSKYQDELFKSINQEIGDYYVYISIL